VVIFQILLEVKWSLSLLEGGHHLGWSLIKAWRGMWGAGGPGGVDIRWAWETHTGWNYGAESVSMGDMSIYSHCSWGS